MQVHNKFFFFLGYFLIAVGIFFFFIITEPGKFPYLLIAGGVGSLALGFRQPLDYEP